MELEIDNLLDEAEEQFIEALNKVFEKRGIDMTPEAACKMAGYYTCMLVGNRKQNLTRIIDPRRRRKSIFTTAWFPPA